MIKIKAYDVDHHQLWINPATAGCPLYPHVEAIDLHGVQTQINITRTGRVRDTMTGLPIISKNGSKRRVAYFRIFDNDALVRIYVAAAGNKAGLSVWEMMRHGEELVEIVGQKPVPLLRTVKVGNTFFLVCGQGCPVGKPLGSWEVDEFDIPIRVYAIGQLFAYSQWETVTENSRSVSGKSVKQVKQDLAAYGDELLARGL